MFKEIRHIGIVVPDLEKAKNFYNDILGFKRIEDKILSGIWFSTMVGIPGASAHIVKMEKGFHVVELLQYANDPGPDHIAITVQDIEERIEQLTRWHGFKFLAKRPVITPDGFKVIYGYHPDTNQYFELVEEL